jgi:hypothetical protein
MNPLDITGALAAEQARDRQALMRRNHLARLASCCHPNAWRRNARRVIARARTPFKHAAAEPAVCC